MFSLFLVLFIIFTLIKQTIRLCACTVNQRPFPKLFCSSLCVQEIPRGGTSGLLYNFTQSIPKLVVLNDVGYV